MKKRDDLDPARGIIYGCGWAALVWIFLILVFIAWRTAEACSAYYTSEYTDGMHRICIYNHLGSNIPYAVPLIKTCPLTVQVPH